MMLQVVLVRHSIGEGLAWKSFYRILLFMDFGYFVNIYFYQSMRCNYKLWF